MNIRNLQYFVVLAEEQHYQRAAERLGIEQSPLSRAINTLEEELRVKLFHRKSKGTRITPVGAAFVDDARRIPEFITRAFAVATSGRPGPVVLTLPEDMLLDEVEAPEAKPYTPVEAHPGPSQIAALGAMLKTAKRPMVVLGGTRWSETSVAGIQAFAEKFKLPVGCSFRRQMLFDHLHPSYAGDVGIGIDADPHRLVHFVVRSRIGLLRCVVIGGCVCSGIGGFGRGLLAAGKKQ